MNTTTSEAMISTHVYDEQIRERMRVLVKTRSQSDLARKTNTLVSAGNSASPRLP